MRVQELDCQLSISQLSLVLVSADRVLSDGRVFGCELGGIASVVVRRVVGCVLVSPCGGHVQRVQRASLRLELSSLSVLEELVISEDLLVVD